MKKKFTTPSIEIMSLNTSYNIMNDLFGNDSYVPVNNVIGDDGAFDGYEEGMYSNGSKVFDEDDKWDSF